MTADEAIALLHSILSSSEQRIQLNDTQIKVFRLIWEGASYGAIAKVAGYEYDYIKQVSSKLWQLLAQQLNQPVSKRNLQTVFQQYAQSISQASELGNRIQGIRCHNLPACNYSSFVGREAETAQLLSFLSFQQSAHCISIEGCGGIGKTTLALSVAHRFLQSPSDFEAIIFASAKPTYLTTDGILSRLQPDRNLRDVFRAIAFTLQCPDIVLQTVDEQFTPIQAQLARQRTLLVIDNLETVEDWQSILAFLYDLPATVKVMLTSRQRTPFSVIALTALADSDSASLIQMQSHAVGIDLNLTVTQQLQQQTRGIPAAIVYAVGLLASGYPIESFTQSVTVGDYARFYVQSSMMLLRSNEFHLLLMAIALFPGSAVKEAIAHVAGITDLDTLTQGLVKLQQLSLISQQHERYTMLPLTREYVMAELNAQTEFKPLAYNRRTDWYLSFAAAHGDKDWHDWHDYTPLEQEWDNLQEVIDWCIAGDRYLDVCQLWQNVRCYSHAQGYRRDRLTCWATRLNWTDWLIQAAERQQDWSTAADVLFDRAWTLTLLGQPHQLDAAESLFFKAWDYRHDTHLSFQIDLAIHIAVWQIQKQQFSDASVWLHDAESRLGTADSIEAIAQQRFWIQLHYYRGEIAYKTDYYTQAQVHFQQALHQAQDIDWRRVVFLAKDWLADIAVQQNDFSNARLLMQEGLHIAQEQGDRCRTAFCMRSMARLEQRQGNQASAQQWAEEASRLFEQLGMIVEATEAIALLQCG